MTKSQAVHILSEMAEQPLSRADRDALDLAIEVLNDSIDEDSAVDDFVKKLEESIL